MTIITTKLLNRLFDERKLLNKFPVYKFLAVCVTGIKLAS